MIFIPLFILCINSAAAIFCYWNSRCPYVYFSSKTSYNNVRGDIRDSVIKVKGCEPVSLWGVIRHGSKYLDKTENELNVGIKDYIVNSHVNGNSSLCSQDVDNIIAWAIDNDLIKRTGEITAEGQQDLIGIANRIKQTFPALITKLEEGNYIIGPETEKSTVDSAQFFIRGLGNSNLKQKPYEEFKPLPPFFKCKKLLQEVFENSLADKYRESTDFIVMKDRIQRRTGLAYKLIDTNIDTIYDLCRYSSSKLKGPSPWCAMLTTDDMKVLEYYGDLKHYYTSGYGNKNSIKFGSFPLVDLLKKFQQAKSGEGNKISVYFSHSHTLDYIYTTLGLYKDDQKLSPSNMKPNRLWRSTKISPFSGNFFAVLSRCEKDDKIEHNVVFYQNEEPLRDVCEEGTCTWEEFEDRLTPLLNITENPCELKKQYCDDTITCS